MEQKVLAQTQAEYDDVDEDRYGSPEPDSDAESGRRIHLLYARKPCPAATQHEIDRAAQAHDIDAMMKAKWLQLHEAEGESNLVEIREHRFWFKDEATGDPLYSGQCDVVWFRGREGKPCDILVGDLKGLWGQHDPSRINLQLRRYIALISCNVNELGYTSVRSAACYINQPAVTMHPQLTIYDENDIGTALMDMQMDVMAITDPNAEPTPHPRACGRCRGKMICEPYIKATGELPVMLTIDREPPAKEILQDRVSTLPAARLGQFIAWSRALKDAVEMAEVEAKKRLKKDEKSVPGYALKPNSDRSKIDDLKKVWVRVHSEYNVESDVFLAKCGMSKESLELLLRELSGLKGKALLEKLNQIVDGATVPIPVGPSLVRT